MAETADSVIIKLQADLGNYQATVSQGADAFEASMARMSTSASATEKAVGTALNGSANAAAESARRVAAAKDGEVAAAQVSADRQVAIETTKQARLRAAVERGLAEQRAAVARGTGVFNTAGYDVRPGETSTAVLPISAATRAEVAAGAGEAALATEQEAKAETEVNYLLRDRIALQAAVANATGVEKAELKEQLTYLNLIDKFQRAGLTTTEATVMAEKQLAIIEAERARTQGLQAVTDAERFAEGAGLGRLGGGAAAIGGLAAATAVGAAVEAIKAADDFAKSLKNESTQLGMTTHDLQVYTAAARELGVNHEALVGAFSHLQSSLGRAQEGFSAQSKLFKALGIDIKDFTSAGDLIPTLIQRISSISDPTLRAAVETRLFGEEGRKLDGMLSGGVDKINELAKALEATGAILGDKDIQDLDQTAKKLEEVKAQLSVDFAQIVAGNASAIMSLARSFQEVVANIKDAIHWIQQFNAQKVAQFNYSGPGGAVADADNAIEHGARRFLGLEPPARPASPPVQLVYQDAQGHTLTPAQAAQHMRPPRGMQAPVRPGSVDHHLLSNLGTPKPRKGRKGPDLEKQQAERDKKFTDEMNAENDKLLALKKQETADADVQRGLDREQIALDLKRQLADVDLQVKLKQIDAGKADELKAAIRAVAAEKNHVLDIQAISQHQKAAAALADQQLQFQADILRSEQAMATTAAERRDIELRLLANAKEKERRDAEAILVDPLASPDQKNQSRAALASLDARYAAQARATTFGSRGPYETYRDSLTPTLKQANEQLQNLEVQQMTALGDAISSAAVKALGLTGALGDVVKQLLNIGIQRKLLGPIADELFGKANGGGTGGAIGGFLSNLFGGGDGTTTSFIPDVISEAPPRAAGGPASAGTLYHVNEQGVEGFRPAGSGDIIPLGQMANRSQGGTVVVQPIQFNLRGAVMTADILAQMNALADQAATRGAIGGAALAQSRARKAQMSALA